MRNRLGISDAASKQLNYLSNRLDLRRNIVCRIAVAKSLTINDSVEDINLGNSKGLEFNRVTLTGDQDVFFKALITQHEKKSIDEEIYFPKYFRNHIERGVDLLYKEYQKINSPVDFLIKLANIEKIN